MANPPFYSNPMDPRLGTQIPGTNRIGGGDAGVNLEQLGLSLGYARDLSDTFHLGAALLLAYQSMEVEGRRRLPGVHPDLHPKHDRQSDDARDIAHAASAITATTVPTAGARKSAPSGTSTPWSAWAHRFAARCTCSEFDKYSDLLAEGGDFDMPAVGTIGLAFRPNKQLTLALDVQQIWYGDVKSIANDNELAQKCDLNAAFGQSTNGSIYNASSCLGGSDGAGFGWRDMTVLKLGIQYALNDALTLRAGYSHGNSPIVGSQVAFNTLAPAVIEDHWTIGATYRMAKNYELTFWGMYAPEETVSGPGAFTGTQAPEISMHQYEIGVNFGWLFN